MAKRFIIKAPFMKAIGRMMSSMVRALIRGPMVVIMKESGKIMSLMVMAIEFS